MVDLPGRVRKAWWVSIKGYDDSDIIYAPTAGKARSKIYYRIDGDISIIDITARRCPERDVILPFRDPIADVLTKDEAHCLLHAFGGNDNPEKAGYRDYFYTMADDEHLVGLQRRGLMSPDYRNASPEGMVYFTMTKLGKHVALSMVKEY